MKELKYLSVWALGFFIILLGLTSYDKHVEDLPIYIYGVFFLSWSGSCYFSYYTNKI